MFGLFKKKKQDTTPADKAAAKGKGVAVKRPAVSADKSAAKKADPDQASLKAAIAAMDGNASLSAPPEKNKEKVSAGVNLDKAKDVLAKKVSGGPMDRKALIEQALAIQKTQAKMLDTLPEETRLKLKALALKTFVLDKPTDKKKLN